MAKHSDDEDAYLYGSDDDNEQPASKKQKITNDGIEKKDGPSKVSTVEKSKTESEDKENDEEDIAEDDDSEEDDESDDDIEFVIGESAPKSGQSISIAGTQNDTTTAIEAEDKKNATTTIVSNQSGKESTIDVNSVAKLDGTPLTQVDLEKLKDKPWRFPGADISDYFNYGFDEFTWTAYCCKQDKLRGEFNPQKLMAQLMSGAGGPPPMPNSKNGNNGTPSNKPTSMLPPMGMPPMGIMPPGMPPMMPGMPNMPNMPNLPNMPNMPNFMNNNNSNRPNQMPNFGIPPPPPPQNRR